MAQQETSARPLQVQHVRTAILGNYEGLVYDQDLRGYDAAGREQRFLSRGLAAEAIRIVTGCDHATAGKAVIDGDRDQGIDAIAVGDSLRDVWLVQAKWSDSGKAKLSKAEALSFADGVRLIADRNFAPFNDRISPIRGRLDAALGNPALQITLVIAVMGPNILSDATIEVLERLRADANVNGPLLKYQISGSGDFHQKLRWDVAPEPIAVTARMRNWIRRDTPFEAWQGTVSVAEIAKWYGEHSDRLFEQNVRNSLGPTRINAGIKETLRSEPENFWYFNNGITVICTGIEPYWPGRRKPDEPVELKLHGVSVVNGAQTVTSIHEAMTQFADRAEDADVTVRVFSLDEQGLRYAKRITETTNTQNDVSAQDFVALDPTQSDIREDFLLSLGMTYVYKRGEPDPAPGTGCSITQAAVALACAHHSPELAVRAARDTNLLWERGSRGAYSRLFGEVPSAYRIWRSVQLCRSVGDALAQVRSTLNGRGADITRRGEMLICHLVFQQIDLDELDDPEVDWAATLERVPYLASVASSWLIYHLDNEFGRNSFLSSTFIDETRCRQLAKLVLADISAGTERPVLPPDYQLSARRPRRPRRPNAVPLLVNAGRIADGTKLYFYPQSEPEQVAVNGWLAEDQRRAYATWVNDRLKCLLWAYDELQYSATGLVQRIWELAAYQDSPVAVQGTKRWMLPSGESIADLALELYKVESGGEYS